MPTYIVEMRGEVRELYTVEADNSEDAARRWDEGDLYLSEASGMELYSVTEDDE